MSRTRNRLRAAFVYVLSACAGCGTEIGPTQQDDRPTQSSSVVDEPLDDNLVPASVEDPPALQVVATTPFCCDAFERVFEATFGEEDLPAYADCLWDFDDGRSARGCRVHHRFDWAGTYRTTVTVSFADGATMLGELVVPVPSPDGGVVDDGSGSGNDDTDGVVSLLVDAGPDFNASAGDLVRLGGAVVAAPASVDIVTRWGQVSGPFVALIGVDTTNASFTALTVVEETVLQFVLTATANGEHASDIVAVRIVPAGPEPPADDDLVDFDPDDATDTIQRALDSGAETVVIPYTGRPWIVRPLELRSGLRLVLEPGVVLEAKAGAFRGATDSLLLGKDVRDVTIVGYGATLRMRKSDYDSDAYEWSEWRHGLCLRGATNVEVLGLRIEQTGGDGIYIGSTRDLRNAASTNIRIQDCTCAENYRQGISVVSGVDVLVENCLISGTSGTPPQAGVNIEPSDPRDKLVNIRFRNCEAQGNAGSGFMTNLSLLDSRSEPIDVLIERCSVYGSRQPGLRAILRHDEGARGTFEFLDCTVEDNRHAGAAVIWDIGSPIQLGFSGCRWSRVAKTEGWPLLFFDLTRTLHAPPGGGVHFTDTRLFNDRPGHTLGVVTTDPDAYWDVRGTIVVSGVHPETLAQPILPNVQVIYQDGGS